MQRVRQYIALICFSVLLPGTNADNLCVSPQGKPDGLGTDKSPLDIGTAMTKAATLPPGSVVRFAPGTYKCGIIRISKEVNGTADKPIIFRAQAGKRVTINGQIEVHGSHVWIQGLELTGEYPYGINILDGDDIKIINCVCHDIATPVQPDGALKPGGQGIGGWDVGNDHEFYGNILFRNGRCSLDHGIYSQNSGKHNTKKYIDNIVFENAGYGMHLYSSEKRLANMFLEGNICFASSKHPKHPSRGFPNIIVGGKQRMRNIVLKNNCAYQPEANAKRSVDIGYMGKGHTGLLLEGNYFMGGGYALELKGIAQGKLVNNTFWAPHSQIIMQITAPKPPDPIAPTNSRS